MKLLLTSSGVTNKTIENALLDLLGRPYKDSNIAFIPTAANIEVGDKNWLVNDMNNFRILGFNIFDVVDISAVSKKIWRTSLEAADIIVFGGGNVAYLSEWLCKSGLDKLLPKMLEDKIYVGISAGSMVATKIVSLSSASILYYEKSGELKTNKGLGLINFEIWPHLNSKWFPKVTVPYLQKLAPKIPKTLYAIDDESALKVVDEKIKVVTEGVWKKFN